MKTLIGHFAVSLRVLCFVIFYFECNRICNRMFLRSINKLNLSVSLDIDSNFCFRFQRWEFCGYLVSICQALRRVAQVRTVVPCLCIERLPEM